MRLWEYRLEVSEQRSKTHINKNNIQINMTILDPKLLKQLSTVLKSVLFYRIIFKPNCPVLQ